MAGQATMKSVKEVKGCIKSLEMNHHMSSGGGDKEMNKQTGTKKIGK